MASPVVFRGHPATAHVVAGFLRNNGWNIVEVVAPTPYLAGPLGHGFVRVEARPADARALLASQRLKQPLEGKRFSFGTRLIAFFLVIYDGLLL